jgi:hypothetical protein
MKLIRWSVFIVHGEHADYLGTIEARDQRAAYRLAIRQFEVPVEQQNHLFVRRAPALTPHRFSFLEAE